jgi:hypothetical protein
MPMKNFGEFMEFFLKCLNTFKFQTRFILDLLMNFNISKSREFWMLGQLVKLFHLKINPTMPCLDDFGLLEDCGF